jgi:hypothetical protein
MSRNKHFRYIIRHQYQSPSKSPSEFLSKYCHCSISPNLTPSPSPSPTYASLVGEELQCGKHGYSARDYGFRFDIDVDVGDMGSVGGRSDRSERGAGDCHVYPRKEEKDRVLEKDKEKEKEREKEKEKDEEGEKLNREQAVESAPLPAIEIEIPCDEMMRECIFVPIPIPLPIPIHPHAGDPLLVEDPGTVANFFLLLLLTFLCNLYVFSFVLIVISFLFLLRLLRPLHILPLYVCSNVLIYFILILSSLSNHH